MTDSDAREQRLARIERGVSHDNGLAIQVARYSHEDVLWLVGEARRVTQLEAERDIWHKLASEEGKRVERLYRERAKLTEERDWQAEKLTAQDAANFELRDEREAAVAALTRVREACDNLTAPFDRMVVRRAIGGNHVGLAVGVADTMGATRTGKAISEAKAAWDFVAHLQDEGEELLAGSLAVALSSAATVAPVAEWRYDADIDDYVISRSPQETTQADR